MCAAQATEGSNLGAREVGEEAPRGVEHAGDGDQATAGQGPSRYQHHDGEDDRRDQHVVEGGLVNHGSDGQRPIWQRATQVAIPEEEVGRRPQMIADDQVADPAECDTKRERGRGSVQEGERRHPVAALIRDRSEDPAEDAAIEGDASLPDPEDAQGVIREEDLRAADHEGETCTNDDPEDRPHEHVPDVLTLDPQVTLGAPREEHPAR